MEQEKRLLNEAIKNRIVWLVDEYKTRNNIQLHETLTYEEMHDLVCGIVKVINMYEGKSEAPDVEEDFV